jgi:cell division protein ZapB
MRDVVESGVLGHCAYRTTALGDAGSGPGEFKLIPRTTGSIVIRMSEPAARSAVDAELKRIERRLEDLVATLNQLKEENRALRQRQDSLITERATCCRRTSRCGRGSRL